MFTSWSGYGLISTPVHLTALKDVSFEQPQVRKHETLFSVSAASDKMWRILRVVNQGQSCLRESHHKDAWANLGEDPGTLNLVIRLVSFALRPLYHWLKCVGPRDSLELTSKIKTAALPKIGMIPVIDPSQPLYRLPSPPTLWRCGPTRAMASSLLTFLDHTQRRITVGKTPLDAWPARSRDFYLTTHNTHNRQTSMPPVGFEPTISADERPQTYALDHAATGTGAFSLGNKILWPETLQVNKNNAFFFLQKKYFVSTNNLHFQTPTWSCFQQFEKIWKSYSLGSVVQDTPGSI